MYTYKAQVIKVVDGDTIDAIVDLGFDVKVEMRFRLTGIDTPEIRTKDIAEKNAGLAAKAKVEQLIGGKQITIKTDKDSSEKYGRYLATIFYGEKLINLNEQLVSEGLAKPYGSN